MKNPFEGLNAQEFQKKCSEIAEELFKNYCLKCGEKTFAFAEIEFYYFNDDERIKLNYNWNEVTYERSKYSAGDLFYHLSGVDICFDSELTKDNKCKKHGYGGGILIRSVVEVNEDGKYIVDKDNNYKITVGPLTCVNMMLNACNGKSMPQIKNISIPERDNFNLKETYRYLGENDFKLIENEKKEKDETNIDGDLKLAFYDPFSIEMWEHARSSYYSKRLAK